jgi:hypothetical protein
VVVGKRKTQDVGGESGERQGPIHSQDRRAGGHQARQRLTETGNSQVPRLQQNATSWDNGCQKPPLLTPFLAQGYHVIS